MKIKSKGQLIVIKPEDLELSGLTVMYSPDCKSVIVSSEFNNFFIKIDRDGVVEKETRVNMNDEEVEELYEETTRLSAEVLNAY